MNVLIVEDRLSKRFPLPAVLDRLLYRRLQWDEATHGSRQPLLLKLEHLVDEAHALLADRVGAGHLDVLEVNDSRVRGVHPDLVDLFGPDDSRGVHGDDDEGLVLVRLAPVARVGQKAHPIGLQAVGNPHLLPVDDPVAALFHRLGTDGERFGICS